MNVPDVKVRPGFSGFSGEIEIRKKIGEGGV